MTGDSAQQRTWRFPRLVVEDYLAFIGLIWAGFAVVVMGIAVGIDVFGTVTGSVWDVATEFVPWYVAFFGGYVVYKVFPTFVAHGRTRRDTAIETVIFMVIFSAVSAVLVTLGYLIEYGFFEMTGWPRDMSRDHLFDSHGDVLAIFAEYWLITLVWVATGGFMGAAFYRYQETGWLALLPASILVGLVGLFTSDYWGPIGFVLERYESEGPSLPFAFVISIASFLAALAMTWPIVRDVPLRNK